MSVKKTNIVLSEDIIMKKYWENNERFADLFNTILFEGKQIIKAEELTDQPTELSNLVEGKAEMKTFPKFRDVLKQSASKGCSFAILGIENQSKVHYAMPLRALIYDVMTYQKQCDAYAKKYQKTKELRNEEFLSHLKKDDRLQPVFTIIVYYGEKSWDGPKTLTDMLDITEEMKKFVSDYQMRLIEVNHSDKKFSNHENQLFFEAVKLFQNQNVSEEEKITNIEKFNAENQCSKDVTLAVAAVTGNKDFIENYHQGGAVDMCTLYEYCEKKGEARGEARGKLIGEANGRVREIIDTGYEFHMTDEAIIKRIQDKLNVSMEMAVEYFKAFKK